MIKDKAIFLHICCAPDATVPVIDLMSLGFSVRGFFYGSNIQPFDEYKKRLDSLFILSRYTGIEVKISEYNPDLWFEKASCLKDEPEGGLRCELCFKLQLEAAAIEAKKEGFENLCTTLTISPHKNVNKIIDIGNEISELYELKWNAKIWRKNNGFLRSIKISKELSLYRQNYCGCIFSKREM